MESGARSFTSADRGLSLARVGGERDGGREERLAERGVDAALTKATEVNRPPPGAGGILSLQRRLGNRVTAELLASAQASMTVGAADDPHEREADAVADAVVGHLRRGPALPAHPALPAQSALPALSEEIGPSGGDLDAGVEGQVDALRAGGSPLPAHLRRSMEGAFGADFDDVRVHRGAESEALNRELGAEAFTVGNDIFVGAGKESLDHPAHRRLLAHELTHTLQQGASRVVARAKSGVGSVGNRAQRAVRRRVLQRFTDEDASKRAREIWQKKGSPEQSKEDQDKDYFEARRQLEVEERAHGIWEEKGKPENQTKEQQQQDWSQAQFQIEAVKKVNAAENPVATKAELTRLGAGVQTFGGASLEYVFRSISDDKKALIRGNGELRDTALALCPADPAKMELLRLLGGPFAAITGWKIGPLLALITDFGTDPAGRTADDWAGVAMAHADLADQAALAAKLARAKWTRAELESLVGAMHTAGAETPGVLAVLGTDGVPAAVHAVGAPWAFDTYGTFAGALLVGATPTDKVGTLLAQADSGTATATMIAAPAQWAPLDLGQFGGGALRQATAARLLALLKEDTFPPASSRLKTAPWDPTKAGTFCGGALTTTVTPAALVVTISTNDTTPALKATTEGADRVEEEKVGKYSGKVTELGVPATYLTALLREGGFQKVVKDVLADGWEEARFAEFTLGAHGTGVNAAALALLLTQASVATQPKIWAGAGYTAEQVGQVFGSAARVGAGQHANVADYLKEAGAPAKAVALHAFNEWDPVSLGEVLGEAAIRNGRPSAAQLVQLMERWQQMRSAGTWATCIPAAARSALVAAACGAPNWAEVITHSATFVTNGINNRAHPDGAPTTFNGLRGGTPYRVRLGLPGERIQHVEAGHTFEYHLWTYANCTRAGVGPGGNSSFFAVGTDVPALLRTLLNDGTVRTRADNAAWNDGTPTQVDITRGGLTLRVGALRNGNPYGPPNNRIYPTKISQCYPRAGGTPIVGRDLVAIGRMGGKIP